MKVLVTGADGQLGWQLSRLQNEHEWLPQVRRQLDITDPSAVNQCIDLLRPDIVVNAAAYTAVDGAETDVDEAFAVNRDGPANLACACERTGVPLLHISTDYVFDGMKGEAYVEEDPTAPLGVYGASKLAGEEAIRRDCSRYLILRTSWLFSAHGNNFVKTMLRLAAGRDELRIVADQHGCPTSTAELGRAIHAVLDRGRATAPWGTYHFCQPESTTWFGFARAVFATARSSGMELRLREVHPITTEEYPLPARRPQYSVLDCAKFSRVFDFSIQPWRRSLKETIEDISGAGHHVCWQD